MPVCLFRDVGDGAKGDGVVSVSRRRWAGVPWEWDGVRVGDGIGYGIVRDCVRDVGDGARSNGARSVGGGVVGCG